MDDDNTPLTHDVPSLYLMLQPTLKPGGRPSPFCPDFAAAGLAAFFAAGALAAALSAGFFLSSTPANSCSCFQFSSRSCLPNSNVLPDHCLPDDFLKEGGAACSAAATFSSSPPPLQP